MLNKDVDWVKYAFVPGLKELAIPCGLLTFCRVGSKVCEECHHFLRRDNDNQLILCAKANKARRPVRASKKDAKTGRRNV